MSCLICEKAVRDHEETVKLIKNSLRSIKDASKIWKGTLLDRIFKLSQDTVHLVHVHCRKEYIIRKRDLDSVKARHASLHSQKTGS